eukprot:symbB.v1.2.001784.t1/scaffold95.1/size600632/32
MGHCALGAKCNFAHSEEEMRPLDTSKLPEPPVELTPEPLMPVARPPRQVVPASSARQPVTATTLQQQRRQLEEQQHLEISREHYLTASCDSI